MLPIVVYLGLNAVFYYVFSAFGIGEKQEIVATDRLNEELPDANVQDMKDKLAAMQLNFGEDEAYTAVGQLGEEVEEKETIDQGYTEDELNRIDAAEAERLRQQKAIDDLNRSLAESRKHINSYSGIGANDDEELSEDEQINRMIRQTQLRQKAISRSLGFESEEEEVARNQRRADSIAEAKRIEKEKNRPNLVIKSREANADKFRSVTAESNHADASLIRAMIDKTTKAHEGTRIRFKLLDDVSVKGTSLKKGTYLYGTVSGFGQQRVMANITSILIGGKFIKVNLSVYDNDGMEGFYVPESAFRAFVKEAGSQTVQQNVNFSSGAESGTEINGETLALQALQNVYNSATGAIAANIRKNRAKIKYNTVVYLINSDESK